MIYQDIQSYVTPDDFKNYTGQDLRTLLQTQDNDSNYPYAFLSLVQDFLINWCDENGFRRIRFDDLQGEKATAFKKAICLQTLYTIKNGALGLGLDSGYDAERGIIADRDALARLEVPQVVVTLLHKSGLFNLKLKPRRRFNRGYPWISSGQDF